MLAYEELRIKEKRKVLVARTSERPSFSRILEQFKLYLAELFLKVAEYENRFTCIPAKVYEFPEQYTSFENSFEDIHTEKNSH